MNLINLTENNWSIFSPYLGGFVPDTRSTESFYNTPYQTVPQSESQSVPQTVPSIPSHAHQQHSPDGPAHVWPQTADLSERYVWNSNWPEYSVTAIIWPTLIRTSWIIHILYTHQWQSMLNCAFNSHAELISTNFPRIFSVNYQVYTVQACSKIFKISRIK